MMKAEWQIIDLIIEVQKIMKLTKKTLRFMIENPVLFVRKKFRCKFNFVTRVPLCYCAREYPAPAKAPYLIWNNLCASLFYHLLLSLASSIITN